jgi:hypothetical protein
MRQGNRSDWHGQASDGRGFGKRACHMCSPYVLVKAAMPIEETERLLMPHCRHCRVPPWASQVGGKRSFAATHRSDGLVDPKPTFACGCRGVAADVRPSSCRWSLGCGYHLRQHEGAKGSNAAGDDGKGLP